MDIYTLANKWLEWDKNEKNRKEIQHFVDEKNEQELRERLENRIQFGTAGLRGPMKAGFANMNDLTVIQASQGLALYVKETIDSALTKGVVVGYDGRHNSQTFARLTAATFLSKGFKVYLFSKLVPTPFVAFAVPELGASCGVMITASHNPKDDNGYKVYWDNGCQINTPHDKGISKLIDENLVPWTMNLDDLNKSDLVSDPLERVSKSYFTKISKYSVVKSGATIKQEKVVYTPMHGVGGDYAAEAFKVFDLHPFIPVELQIKPDAEFPTVAFPNPEEGKGALKLAIETAESNQSRLILANDPDADRLAVAEKQSSDGSWKVFNGNEIGVLFADWAWRKERALFSEGYNCKPSEYTMISTAVSSAMLSTMAKKEGFQHEEVLTGFKWVGNAAKQAMDRGQKFLFAYEEAIGFMYGDVSLDKDGVRGASIFAELAFDLYQQGSSCQEHLESLYKKYGYHISNNRYFFCYDPKKMVRIFNEIRGNNREYVKELGEFKVERIRDLTTGYDTAFPPEFKAQLPTSSSTQMITFYFTNGSIATLRGSGTEPKLKYYVESIGSDKLQVQQTLTKLVSLVIEKLLRPKENELTPPKE
ncbi:phosphoglucomutase [Tieghemostelium lacteum]|uniref:Phosphoglucomutase n=1 Tax=Tieghemostelium lacteum TaxID=361077 RepID=A0A151Z647_TIELA|nr:phosphoglucomutase [Tieghemostelium lacteum]|eukprot:KYQ89432.1 phosphoglucomutase [Tieghemostelium lacteum]